MIKKTKFKDLILINNVSFKDNRGYFRELLKEKYLGLRIKQTLEDSLYYGKCFSL